MTSRKEVSATYQQAWNAENMLAVVTNTTSNQVSKFALRQREARRSGQAYDGDGARVKGAISCAGSVERQHSADHDALYWRH